MVRGRRSSCMVIDSEVPACLVEALLADESCSTKVLMVVFTNRRLT